MTSVHELQMAVNAMWMLGLALRVLREQLMHGLAEPSLQFLEWNLNHIACFPNAIPTVHSQLHRDQSASGLSRSAQIPRAAAQQALTCTFLLIFKMI